MSRWVPNESLSAVFGAYAGIAVLATGQMLYQTMMRPSPVLANEPKVHIEMPCVRSPFAYKLGVCSYGIASDATHEEWFSGETYVGSIERFDDGFKVRPHKIGRDFYVGLDAQHRMLWRSENSDLTPKRHIRE